MAGYYFRNPSLNFGDHGTDTRFPNADVACVTAGGRRRSAHLRRCRSFATDFKLSAEDRSHLLPSGRQTTFANHVHWAKSYLGKAGLIELTRRAHFQITDRGREALASPPDRIDIKYLGRFPEFQKFREAEGQSEDEAPTAMIGGAIGALTPDEVIRNASRQLEVALADELLQRIRASTPAFFESLVVRLLVAMNYGGSVTELDKALVGGTGDGGVDGVIDQDPLGLAGKKIRRREHGWSRRNPRLFRKSRSL